MVDRGGDNAGRSTFDLEWMALAEEAVADDGKWYDARLIDGDGFQHMVEPGASFTTRGIAILVPDDEVVLTVPDTPTTDMVILTLRGLSGEADGHHDDIVDHPVEVTGKLSSGGEELFLEVEHIRRLAPGETIHHPDYEPSVVGTPGPQQQKQ
jgi:hypothetical protein